MYRFQLAQQTHSARPHLIKLHRDASFGRDARDRAFSVLLVDHLTSQTQTSIDPTDHRQHGHQTAHRRSVRVGQILLQQRLSENTNTSVTLFL